MLLNVDVNVEIFFLAVFPHTKHQHSIILSHATFISMLCATILHAFFS